VKVLIVGGGGREHAIAWKLKRDDPTLDLHCAPGNRDASLATCHATQGNDLDGLVTQAIWERPDLPSSVRSTAGCRSGRPFGVARIPGL
jgi:phosphoribosylamine--glycine ligase